MKTITKKSKLNSRHFVDEVFDQGEDYINSILSLISELETAKETYKDRLIQLSIESFKLQLEAEIREIRSTRAMREYGFIEDRNFITDLKQKAHCDNFKIAV